jgi:hypothetical protein
VGDAQLVPETAELDDGPGAPGLGQFQGDQGIADAASDARGEGAGQRGTDRPQRGEQGADVVDRAQDRVPSAEVHQASHLPEDPRQDQDGVIQVLHQEVQEGQGVSEEQVFHLAADLVPVEQDVLWISHILLMSRGSLRSPGPFKIQ